MQDGIIADRESVSGQACVTVPASVVDALRRALYAQIGLAAEALDGVAFERDREAHPEWFRGPAQSLRESYELLDMLGWAAVAPAVPVRVDLQGCCWALMRALASALEFADEDVSEHMRRDVEKRGRAAERECVGVLCDFIAVAQARINALAVEESGEQAEAAA
jgi:hypothetical protein